jgi:capsular polysaccharide biosynthesis protein
MTFADYVGVLRRFAWLIIVWALAGANIALLALALPKAEYEASFAVTLAPNTSDSGNYGNLIDALDRRSVPSTFAQIVMSPLTKDSAASTGRVDRSGLDVKAVVVADSNVIEATVSGEDRQRARDFAAALLPASQSTFRSLYPAYTVTPLRNPENASEVPRHLPAGLLLGGLAGAILAYLLALAIDANRRPRARMKPASVEAQRVE